MEDEQLVTKRGTTSVARSRVFKRCSFKTTDFKPLKLKQSYMLVFASILKHSDLGLKRINNNNNDIFIICIESIHNTRVNYIYHRWV